MNGLKITLVSLTLFFLSSQISGQGFSVFKPEGAIVPTHIKNNTPPAINSVVETIVTADQNIKSLTVKHKLVSNCTVDPSTALSNDYTHPQTYKINRDGASKDWDVIVHQLQPAPLPLSITFSKENPCDLTFTNPKPWAGYGLDYSKPTVARMGNAGVALFIAFESKAESVTFSLTNVSKNQFMGELDVEYSADAKKWSNLTTYTEQKPFQAQQTLPLPSDARYVRWVYAVREKQNININNILIK